MDLTPPPTPSLNPVAVLLAADVPQLPPACGLRRPRAGVPPLPATVTEADDVLLTVLSLSLSLVVADLAVEG